MEISFFPLAMAVFEGGKNLVDLSIGNHVPQMYEVWKRYLAFSCDGFIVFNKTLQKSLPIILFFLIKM